MTFKCSPLLDGMTPAIFGALLRLTDRRGSQAPTELQRQAAADAVARFDAFIAKHRSPNELRMLERIERDDTRTTKLKRARRSRA